MVGNDSAQHGGKGNSPMDEGGRADGTDQEGDESGDGVNHHVGSASSTGHVEVESLALTQPSETNAADAAAAPHRPNVIDLSSTPSDSQGHSQQQSTAELPPLQGIAWMTSTLKASHSQPPPQHLT